MKNQRDKLKEKCLELLSDRPNLNNTELAQAIVGGYKGDLYPEYNKTALIINDLRRNNDIPKGNYER